MLLYNCFHYIAIIEVIVDSWAGTMRKEVLLGSLKNTVCEARLYNRVQTLESDYLGLNLNIGGFGQATVDQCHLPHR